MSDVVHGIMAEAYRAFRLHQEARVCVLLGIPPEDGFVRNMVRMTTRADCQCSGSGIRFDFATMILSECPCVRYERADVKATE